MYLLKRYTLTLTILFGGLIGCKSDQAGSARSGGVAFDMICIDGVEYLLVRNRGSSSQMAPHFKPDGTLYPCTVEK